MPSNIHDEPKPEDYPNKVNVFIRAHRRWEGTQPFRPLELIPIDLECLFTPESLEEARVRLKVDKESLKKWVEGDNDKKN